MQNRTEQMIQEVAFRCFLEKGYEATNLREISDEIGIKTASLYFYYNSKRELFLHILTRTCHQQIDILRDRMTGITHLPAGEQLFTLYLNILRSCYQYHAAYRFLLRYKLYPAFDLSADIRNVFLELRQNASELLSPLIARCREAGLLAPQVTDKQFLTQYKQFVDTAIHAVIITGISLSPKTELFWWEHFCEQNLMQAVSVMTGLSKQTP